MLQRMDHSVVQVEVAACLIDYIVRYQAVSIMEQSVHARKLKYTVFQCQYFVQYQC